MRFDFLEAKSPPLIGVDISSSSVKMVELAEAGKDLYRVERYAIESLPKDAVVDGNIVNLEAVGETLKLAWKRMGGGIKNVALALPSAAVITKKIMFKPACEMRSWNFRLKPRPTNIFPSPWMR